MKLLFYGIVVLVLLAILTGLTWRTVLLALGDVLIVQDELVPADVIHVISGPNYRIDHSVLLYQQGYGKQLFYTGRQSQSYIQRRRAIRQGVPPEAVVADGSYVTSTYSEAVRLQAYIDQSETPIRSVIGTSRSPASVLGALQVPSRAS